MTRSLRPGAVVYLYVLGASPDPDHVRCGVPWEVDPDEVFFGPCKKPLRGRLKREVLRDEEEVVLGADIFVVGVNALGSASALRKVVWAGRINRVMTFARAYERLAGPRYEKMRAAELSPLHVEPIRGDGDQLRGYRFRPNGNHPGDWVQDLVRSRRGPVRDGDRLMVRPGRRASGEFTLDACFTAEHLFFARGHGLSIDAELVALLKQAQPDRTGIDQLAIFGRTARGADGRRGGFLTVSRPDLVRSILRWLMARRPSRPPAGGSERPRASRSCG